ncbi:unnamed protein product [Lampetra planeri]
MLRRSGLTAPVNDRAGVTLSFSGFFLVFAGLTLTCMGWLYYTRHSQSFDWSQVLGPILMGLGVVFLLLAAWRLRTLICCRSRGEQEEEDTEMRRRFEAFGILVASIQAPGNPTASPASDHGFLPPPPYDPESAPPAYSGGGGGRGGGYVNRACEGEMEEQAVPGAGAVAAMGMGIEPGRQRSAELSPRPSSDVPWKESTFPAMPPSYEEAIAEAALCPLPSLPALPSAAALPSQPGPENDITSNALSTSPARTDAAKLDS